MENHFQGDDRFKNPLTRREFLHLTYFTMTAFGAWYVKKILEKFFPQEDKKILTQTPPSLSKNELPKEQPTELPQALPIELNGNFPQTVAQWAPQLTLTAEKYNLPPELGGAIIWRESKGNPNAISNAGAIGLMQVMPGEQLAGRPLAEKLLDPQTNIDWGYQILKKYLEKNKNDLYAALNDYYGSSEPVLADNQYYDSYASLILDTWKNFSPETFENYFSSFNSNNEPLINPEFNLSSDYILKEAVEGAKLYSKPNIYLAIYDPQKLAINIITSSYWNNFSDFYNKRKLVSAFSGTHYLQGKLEFPFKENNKVYPSQTNKFHDSKQLRMLAIYSDHAEIYPYSEQKFNLIDAETVISGETIEAPREWKRATARTVAAVDGQGKLIIVMFKSADREMVYQTLKQLNIDPKKTLNLGGGGQAGFMFNGKEYISSTKEVTHIIGIKNK